MQTVKYAKARTKSNKLVVRMTDAKNNVDSRKYYQTRIGGMAVIVRQK